MNETDGNQIRLYLEHNYQLTSERCISIGLSVSAGNNSFHPIRDRLEGLVWDGEERIGRALHHFLGAEENEYTAEVLKMHMLAAISRIYFPGCKYDIALCLVGPQGGGKSTFFRFLAIEDEWFTDDLRRLEDKRVFEKMNGHWIIELSEMSTIAAARSIEETKVRCIGWDDRAGSRKFKRYGSQKAWEPVMKGDEEPEKKKNGFKEVPDDITLPF